MDIKDFKAGNLKKQYEYNSFSPNKINIEWIISDPEINSLLGEANRKIGELNAFSQLIPDVDFFIMMHITKEATKSSRIEGTQTSIEEAFIKEEDIKPERRNDYKEVHNYVSAMNYAISELENLPLSNRLLKKGHEILLTSVRGEKKTPGEFRRSQNWIGATLKDAVFIPPTADEVNELMSDLEKFLNNNNINVPHLIKIAIGHYQFETIHPFLDGNGRLGRLLITLYLVSNKILVKPTLYLSDFFERNKIYYYDNLTIARTNNNISQWIKFFLAGVVETSQNSIETFNSIIKLKQKLESEVLLKMGKKHIRAKKLLDELYKNPIVDSSIVMKILNVTPTTSNNLIKEFAKFGILVELTGFKRNRLYIFDEYVKIFQK
jgi:Fic family protein